MKRIYFGAGSALIIAAVLAAGTANGSDILMRRQVTAIYKGIRIIAEGKVVPTQEEPFIKVDTGVTMVPIRAVAQALGEPVHWDGSGSTVFIGTVPTEKAAASEKHKFLEELTVLRNVGDFVSITSREVRIAGEQFEHAVVCSISDGKTAEFVVDTWNKYSRVEGRFGVEDATRDSGRGIILTVLDGEEVLYTSNDIRPATGAAPFSVDIKGRRRLTFRVQCFDIGVGDYSEVSAALADVRFYQH